MEEYQSIHSDYIKMCFYLFTADPLVLHCQWVCHGSKAWHGRGKCQHTRGSENPLFDLSHTLSFINQLIKHQHTFKYHKLYPICFKMTCLRFTECCQVSLGESLFVGMIGYNRMNHATGWKAKSRTGCKNDLES